MKIIKVLLLLGERGWILEAIAINWIRKFNKNKKINSSINSYDSSSQFDSDIIIHFIFTNAVLIKGKINIAYVTHIDNSYKSLLIGYLTFNNFYFITMSQHTKKYIEHIQPTAKVFCVNPESLHFEKTDRKSKKIIFGFFFRIYSDGRKNNALLIKIFNFIIKNNDKASFIIYGNGFEKLLNCINIKDCHNDFIYDSSEFNLDKYKMYLNECNYVIYPGMDEGAISILDACYLNIPVITTDQGYHRDLDLAFGSQLCEHPEQIYTTIKQIISANNGSKYSNFEDLDFLNLSPTRNDLYSYFYILYNIIITPFKSNPFRVSNDFRASLSYLIRNFISKVK